MFYYQGRQTGIKFMRLTQVLYVPVCQHLLANLHNSCRVRSIHSNIQDGTDDTKRIRKENIQEKNICVCIFLNL